MARLTERQDGGRGRPRDGGGGRGRPRDGGGSRGRPRDGWLVGWRCIFWYTSSMYGALSRRQCCFVYLQLLTFVTYFFHLFFPRFTILHPFFFHHFAS